MKNNLEILKENLNGSFDVKYREVDSNIGKVTIVFIDILCNTEFISDYIINPIINKNIEKHKKRISRSKRSIDSFFI